MKSPNCNQNSERRSNSNASATVSKIGSKASTRRSIPVRPGAKSFATAKRRSPQRLKPSKPGLTNSNLRTSARCSTSTRKPTGSSSNWTASNQTLRTSDEIESIEQRIVAEDDLVAERDRLLDELESCRTRIDQIEADAVEEFNTHMDAILDVLGYDNLDRIWIERLEQTVREGRQKVQQTVFELHVVRSTENGTAYEDTIDHLSESEREVTGLIFALAGYLVHDVHEVVPFMLLDSLEAIDSDRIAKLVDYFADYAEYVVVALLPEDAQALSEDYARITSI